MRPFVNNLLRSASAHVRSFSNPTPPESPSTTTTENAGTDVADSSTPQPSQQRLSPPSGEEPAGVNADTAPSLPQTPENRRYVMQTDGASSDTTVVAADDVETAEEKRRRKRREKEARQRQRRQTGSGGGGGGNERREEEEEEDEGVSLGGGALPGSQDGAVVDEDDGPRVESRAEVDDARVDSSDQIQTVKADDDDGKAIRVVVKEVEVGEEDDGLDGKNTAEERPLVDQASDFEPGDATHSEPQLVVPTSNNKTEHDELVRPTHAELQLFDSPSTSEPERTKHDHRRSAQRLLAAGTDNKPPSRIIPTIPQIYPKDGLGLTIEIPEHRFIIDSLDPPLPPTKTQPSAPSQPIPNLPKSLVALQATDFTDPLRAAHMSAAAHNLLADRLWRTVRFANYFYSPPVRKPAIIVNLPPTNSQSLSPRQQRLARLASRPPPPQHYQAAVEKGVASFLRRTRKNDAEHREEMNKFTRANRDMAFLLNPSLALERVVTKKELFDMFEASYGRGGEDGVDWKVDLIGLGVLFDGGDSWRRFVF